MVNFASFTDKYNRLMIKLRDLLSESLLLMKGHWLKAIAVFFVFNLIIALVQAIPGIGGFLSLLITGPFSVGVSLYCVKIINDNFPKFDDLLFGFQYNLGNNVLAYFIIIPIVAIVGIILMILFLLINFAIFLLIISIVYTQSYEAFINTMEWEALLTPFRSLSIGLAAESIMLLMFCILSFCFSFILPWIIAYIPFAMTFFIMAEDTSIDAWDAVQKSWKMMKGYKFNFFVLNLILLLLLALTPFTLFIGLLWYIPFSYVVTANYYEKIK